MMEHTNSFLRQLLRQLSARQTLYTEMVTANKVMQHTKDGKCFILDREGELRQGRKVLQLGGAAPDVLRDAAAVALPNGFSALNLNVGCPSPRVAGSGRFGAALMREPELVADCCAAMADGAAGTLPVTVKCRIGVTKDRKRAAEVDDEPTYEELARFVDTVSTRGGVTTFIVHARKAVLGGLSPAENRQIPPLRYHLVRRLASEFPHLRFALNGGIDSLDAAVEQLSWASEVHRGQQAQQQQAQQQQAQQQQAQQQQSQQQPTTTAEGAPQATGTGGGGGQLTGVMVGRAVIARPWDWATVDTRLYGCASDPATSRRQVIDEYCAWLDAVEAAQGHSRTRILSLAPPALLFAGEPRNKAFKARMLQLSTQKATTTRTRTSRLSTTDAIRMAAEEVLLPQTLDAAPGLVWLRGGEGQALDGGEYVTPEELAREAARRRAGREARAHLEEQQLKQQAVG